MSGREMLSLDTRKRMCCQGTLIDDQFQPECFPLGTRFDLDQVYCCASSAPTRPIEILPFQLQSLISDSPLSSNASAVTRHRSTGSGDFFGTGVSPLDSFSRVTNAAPRPSRPSRDAQQTPSTQQEIVCAQALNKDIFVGCSDGTLMRYTTKEDNYSGDPYHIVSQQVVPGGKPIDRIALVPFLCKMLVLSGGTFYFHTLLSSDALPPTQISPLRGVLTFSLDENALRVHPN
ncbi:hypothetical protein FRC03_003405 [Tulasnella sp. 419]|nr:hypothetical protein FRC03_003405 [Tulasnella sp. 419]